MRKRVFALTRLLKTSPHASILPVSFSRSLVVSFSPLLNPTSLYSLLTSPALIQVLRVGRVSDRQLLLVRG